MSQNDVFFDSQCRLGDTKNYVEGLHETKWMSKGKCRSLDTISNSEVHFDLDNETSYHDFEKKRSTRKKRTDFKHSGTNHRVIPPRRYLKRQRSSCNDYHDYHSTYSSHENSVNQIQSSLKEHPTMNVTCSDRSASSLCSTSESSSSTQHMLQHNYSSSCSNIQNETRRLLVENIRERFLPMLKGTSLRPKDDKILTLHANDVIPIHPYVLGEGTFSRVTRVAIRTDNAIIKEFACKKLKQDLLSNPKEYIKAATELAYEAYILSCFDHQNIIELRGYAADGIASFGDIATDMHGSLPAPFSSCSFSPQPSSFFLIMDILQETLDQRIERWKTNDRPKNIVETHKRCFEKISLCRQLASVLEYIHSKGVVFRDLKPQNIGFCEREGEILKLFDFGLTRELPQSIANAPESNQTSFNANEHMRFDLSGMVGTIRYMAPEVCLSQPYNRDCDIYSWSVVAWEIWSQSKPYAAFTPDLYQTLVCRQGYRPTDQKFHSSECDNSTVVVPSDLELLLKEAWKHEPHERIRWSGIQRHLDAFQNSENLRLKESIRIRLQHQSLEDHSSLEIHRHGKYHNF